MKNYFRGIFLAIISEFISLQECSSWSGYDGHVVDTVGDGRTTGDRIADFGDGLAVDFIGVVALYDGLLTVLHPFPCG